MSLADDILQAAARPLRTRRPVPGETVYVIRKSPVRADYIPPLSVLVNKCYIRRVQLNGARIIVMTPGVYDFTGEGTFCTYSAYEFFHDYTAALKYAADVVQALIDGFDQQRQTAAELMAEIQSQLAQEHDQ